MINKTTGGCRNCGQRRCSRSSCNRCSQRGCSSCCRNRDGGKGRVEADYVIVGLGTAGAPLAKFLTDDKRTSVIVLEAGENRGEDPQVKLANFPPPPNLFWDPKFSYMRYAFPNRVNPGSRNPPYAVSEARLWGGGASHSGLFAVRGTPESYNAWGLIDPMWSYNALLPFMRALETYTPAGTPLDPTERGTSGPLFVTQRPPLAAPNFGFYNAAAAAMNAGFLPDANNPKMGEVGVSQLEQYVDPTRTFRSDTQTAFLTPDVVTPDGHGVDGRLLEIVSRATATELILDLTMSPPTAVGVRYFLGEDRQEVRDVYARKKVILCAGVVANVKILQVSGIGPASTLAPLGLPVIVDNPNVGRHIQTHNGVAAILPQSTSQPTPIPELVFIFSDNSGANITQPNDGVRRVEWVFTPNRYVFVTDMVKHALGIENTPVISAYGHLVAPVPRLGTIDMISRDPISEPHIRYHFYEDGPDASGKTQLDRAVDAYYSIANASLAYSGQMPLYPLARDYPTFYPGGTQPDDQLLRQIALDDPSQLTSIEHQCGSCRMATSAADGVVDANLNVFGVRNLSIADNSVVPEIPSGHTVWCAIIIGMKKAQIEGAVVPVA